MPSRESGVPAASAPNYGDRSIRFLSYGKKPGIAVFIGQRIFNRPFRKDVNAGMIAFGHFCARLIWGVRIRACEGAVKAMR